MEAKVILQQDVLKLAEGKKIAKKITAPTPAQTAIKEESPKEKQKDEEPAADVAAIYVTEYYDLKFIDAHTAYFVIGSDVCGPMGRELIPFETLDDAKAFMKDHKGERILRFENVRERTIKKLD